MDSFDYAAVIRQYKALKPDYEHLAVCLQAQLKDLCQSAGITPIISGRAKSLESFADKICREGKHYDEPVTEITDLCGVRVIVHTLDEVEELATRIKSDFVIDEMNSVDKQAILDIDKFGYLSRHFIIRPAETSDIEGCVAGDFRSLKNPRAEIQLRTLAQHVWADNYHELGYKNEFTLPARWQREFARLAASLENCDEAFMDIKRSMATYESNYGAYLSQDELNHLVKRLEVLVIEDPENINVLHRLIRVYSSLDDKLENIERLFEHHAESLSNSAPALRDIGVVMCRRYQAGSEKFHEGLNLLEKAVELAPADVDALSSLGGALRRASQPEASLDCYRRAHHINPANPYPLLNYIAGEITRTGDVGLVQNFYAAMEMAKNRCQKQIDVGINLPWSYFDMGQIALFLGNVDESISWVAKAIEQSASSWMIRSARQPIMAIQSVTNKLDGCGLIGLLLEVGEKAKSILENEFEVDITYNKELFPDGPILVLAGGCSNMEDGYKEQLHLLTDVLANYQGTIVSGGTNVGIPGMVGQISGNDKPYTIGYLPSEEMSGLQEFIESRYNILRYTKAKEFTFEVALQFWEDLLESGRQPTTLKLIGFNGGDISAAEYRVALALGAQVGIVSGSGRAADALLQDALWEKHPGLHVLEPDVKSLTNFLYNDS